MKLEEEIEKVNLVRRYEITKARLKGTIKLMALWNQDIDELMKKLDAIRAGEELETPLKDVIENMLDDLNELESLMSQKKQFEKELKDLGLEEKPKTEE